jgi:uncharacterized protein YgbK (DUF1537 family)
MMITVIADDLTGALDTGVKFTQWGYTAQLTDAPERSTAEVMIINTDTRNKDPEIAYNITYNVAEKLNQHDIIYKKIDSTLRGNPGPELQAILDATGETNAILTPTYPPTHRRVKDGHLYIADKPITETEYIYEYRKKTSYIPEILDRKTTIHTIKIHENIPPKGITIIDSETEKDLLKVAARRTRVVAGSAGLADALCQTLKTPPPVLTVIGSMRSETRMQVKQLQRRLDAATIPLNTIKALNQTPQPETLRKAIDALNLGQDIILTSTLSTETIEKTKQEAKRLNIPLEELETKIITTLAETTESLLNHTLSGLIITGGATALAITKKLGIEKIQILDEVQPGVPVIKLDHITAVTKAGGFGQTDTLIQATQYLKRNHS